MKVSVIIPTYNYAQYISSALNSILSQDYDQSLIEVIVIDDGSTDNTKEVVSQYKERFQLLKYYKTINQGKAAATYLGFQHANGDVIFNLDADDFFLSSKVAKVVDIFNTYPSVTHVAHPALIAINGSPTEDKEAIPSQITDKEISSNFILEYFLSNNVLWGGGSTYAVRKINGFLPENTFAVDMYIDEYLVYRSLTFGNSFFLSEPLSYWNIHQSNYSINSNKFFLNADRMVKSAQGLLELLQGANFRYADLYKIKYFCILTYYAQQRQDYGAWLYNNFKLFYFCSIILLRRPIISFRVFRSYNIVKRLLPPIIYNRLKRSK
jgi:glycosyltransferase involved in cell wall biosynthesis